MMLLSRSVGETYREFYTHLYCNTCRNIGVRNDNKVCWNFEKIFWNPAFKNERAVRRDCGVLNPYCCRETERANPFCQINGFSVRIILDKLNS
jgi:hypothetical protein